MICLEIKSKEYIDCSRFSSAAMEFLASEFSTAVYCVKTNRVYNPLCGYSKVTNGSPRSLCNALFTMALGGLGDHESMGNYFDPYVAFVVPEDKLGKSLVQLREVYLEPAASCLRSFMNTVYLVKSANNPGEPNLDYFASTSEEIKEVIRHRHGCDHPDDRLEVDFEELTVTLTHNNKPTGDKWILVPVKKWVQ